MGNISPAIFNNVNYDQITSETKCDENLLHFLLKTAGDEIEYVESL